MKWRCHLPLRLTLFLPVWCVKRMLSSPSPLHGHLVYLCSYPWLHIDGAGQPAHGALQRKGCRGQSDMTHVSQGVFHCCIPDFPINTWSLGSQMLKEHSRSILFPDGSAVFQVSDRQWSSICDTGNGSGNSNCPTGRGVCLVACMASSPQHPLTSLTPCFISKKSTLHCGKQPGR